MEAKGTAPKQLVHVYLDPETIAHLDALAEQEDRPRGYIVRKLVNSSLAHLDALAAGAEEAIQCPR